MNAFWRSSALLISLLLASTQANSFNQSDLFKKNFKLTILHINDHHSHLAADEFDFDVSHINLTASTESGEPVSSVTLSYGGFPLITEAFNRYENLYKKRGKNLVKIHAGDAITGTLYYTLFEGRADAEMMNQICFDIFAIGNHEFDDGDLGLANFLSALSNGNCNTDILSANLELGPDSPAQQSNIQPLSIRWFGDEPVGFVGLTIAQKTKVSSNPDADTNFADELQSAQSSIDALRFWGVDKIVLVTHITYQADINLAQQLDGVDVIVGGDSHSLLGGEKLSALGFSPVGDYPTVTRDVNGNKVCIVQAWEYAHLMGKLNVTFDNRGNVKKCSGHPVIPVDADSYQYAYSDAENRTLKGMDRHKVTRALAKTGVVKPLRADHTSTQLLAQFNQQVDELKQTVIGNVADNLCLERFPGQGRGTPLCTPAETSVYGSDISNIVAKAFLTVTPTADFAIQNGGGVRVNVEAGDYTIADAYTLLPFTNTLVTLEMTGQQIKDVLEDALANTLDNGGSSGSYPYASGLRYFIDASAAFGARVSNLEMNSRVAGEWQALDLNGVYTVVTNDFIAAGRDGYLTFGDIFNAGDYVDTYTEYAQGFINYVELLAENGSAVSKLPISEYSTQQYTGRDGCVHSSPQACAGY